MLAVIAVGFALLAASAKAQIRATPGWADERALADTLEVHGVIFGSSRRAIDSAYCRGLLRYGHREIGYVDQYHRFKCGLDGADNHGYTVSVTITRSSVSTMPLPGRGEPSYLARELRDAKEALAQAEAQIAGGPPKTEEQKRGLAQFLRPYKEAVSDAKAALEPYRTKFVWRVTTIRRDY